MNIDAKRYAKSVDAKQLRKSAKDHLAKQQFIPGLIALDRLIELNQATASDWNETGKALCALGEFAQAIGAFENCLSLDATNQEARHDLGRTFYKLGDADRAVRLLAKVASETDLLPIKMGLATIVPGAPNCDHQHVLRFRHSYASAVRMDEQVTPTKQQSRHLNRRKRQSGKLRIGYVSAHFHGANYMKPVWPLINSHSNEMEIFLFDDADEPADYDWLHRQAHIQRVAGQTNCVMADTIRSSQLDILVDLSAYSKPQRMGVFVNRPAPIQAAWFNMFATSGFEEIDFVIGDAVVVKTNEEKYYSESVKRLPTSYLTFQTNHLAPEVAALPSSSHGEFVFGCLSTQYKITPVVLQAWSIILKRANNARLLLANQQMKSPHNRQYLLDQFADLGIDTGRIEFLPPASHIDFLQYYDRIDLALDTFPYSGGTTAMEALWQGVPVVTFDGDRWASRTCASLLRHSHIPQFVGQDVQDYCRIALMYALDKHRQNELGLIRRTMREKIVQSSVCNSAALAKSMEKLFGTLTQQT